MATVNEDADLRRAETPEDHRWTVETLVRCLVLFSIVTIGVSWMFPNNPSLIAVFSTLVGNFSGALFLKVKS